MPSTAAIVGLGVDVVNVDRISEMLARHRARFLARVFTPGEVAHSAGRRTRAQHLAARFACKEAVMKALGTGLTAGITWLDVEVITEASGKPTLALHGQAKRTATRLKIKYWTISLSHTREHAVAVAIAQA
jgi:holo-[acyl-carrier protein] synthase